MPKWMILLFKKTTMTTDRLLSDLNMEEEAAMDDEIATDIHEEENNEVDVLDEDEEYVDDINVDEEMLKELLADEEEY